jgi:SRSO17 transposase
VLCIGRHTVTGVLRASGAVGEKHHTSFHRFFRTAAWQLDAIGLCLIPLIVKLLPADEPIVVSLDDTLGRHTGKHIRGASMHHDPLLSTRAKPVFHWGHLWVVVSIVVRVPLWKKTLALPVLARLYRSAKLCEKDKRPFRKKTELAAELIAILAGALPERRIRIVADANYANASVLKKLPSNVDFIGRALMDAAVYARPRRKRMGRPAVKGGRLPSPKQRGRSPEGWRRVKVEVYGKVVVVQVKSSTSFGTGPRAGECCDLFLCAAGPDTRRTMSSVRAISP